MSNDYSRSSSSSSSSSSSYFSSSDSQDDVSDSDSVGSDLYLHTNYTVTGTGMTDPGADIVANITVDHDDNIIDVYDHDGDDGDDGHDGHDGHGSSVKGRITRPLCDISDIEYRLQTSIFYVEPVTHITCQLMFVDSASNTLAQIDTRVMRLATPNTIDRFDIGRIIKASRYAPDGSLKFRLGSLFVYNAHVSPAQLSLYVTNPDAFSFVTHLTSISTFIIKPTMACFHSLNSIHIVLHSLGVVAPVLDPYSNTEGQWQWHASSKPVSKSTTSTRRTVTITKKALATRRNNHNK